MPQNEKALFTFYICLSEILSMAATMFFPTLLPHFQAEWKLSHTEAGFISGIFFAGYALGSTVLVSLTDRKDTRFIYILSAALAALSMLGFALFARGAWTAALFRFTAGVGLAGTYMPGLKILSETVSGTGQSRAVAFYTSSYGLGMALSVFLSGLLFRYFDWQWSAGLLAAGTALCILIFGWTVRKVRHGSPGIEAASISSSAAPWYAVFDFRKVLRNRPAMGYILGYSLHCWELFGFRSWMVAFLFFCAGLHPGSAPPLTIPGIATLIILAGVPASILGNEASLRWGRERSIAIFMILSGTIGCLIGFTIHAPLGITVLMSFLYGITIMLDSGSLTAGLVLRAAAGESGVTMAVYSFAGFVMAFLAPLAFGAVMDLFGSGIWGWGLAFAILGIANLTGPVWQRALRSR